jgi:signal transduction histidine kinase
LQDAINRTGLKLFTADGLASSEALERTRESNMPDQPHSEAEERAKIAQHLEQNRERIISDWLQTVQSDDQIPSADGLTMTALRDHFPEMLTELISSVRLGDPEKNESQVRDTGRDHGKARWRNGYRLDEVLRELARIREIITGEVTAFCRDSISEASREKAIQSSGRLFDSVVAASAQQFVKAQDSELVLRSSQLQHAYELVHAATEEFRYVAQSRLSLLRAVNHELRNALQPVTAAADLMQKESELADRREAGDRLFRVANRLQGFLDRLRDLSLLLAGEVRVRVETINLEELLNALVESHRIDAVEKGLRLEAHLAADLTEVKSDREKLRQIASNLLTNAIKFTATGFVRLEMFPAEANRWILSVSDSGSGIDPSESRHIFQELHVTSDSPETGPRLGLVITRHLTHLLEGEITFKSTLGAGSSFQVNLPLEMTGDAV